MLIRGSGADEYVVPETPLPLEANLHHALTKHPEFLPSEDMGLGRIVVVGRESTFPSGAADLILVDDRGQVCLVEVKKEGNPDVRRVVAQLLDYAAGLWGKTLLEFEQDVFLPYAQKAGGLPISLRVLLADKFGRRVDEGATDDTELQPSVEEIETALGENLLSGRFVLVVAAPVIPEPVRRVLDYMNAPGLRLYGLEVSYFNGPAECFVPRLAVQPPPLDQIATKGSRVWDQAAILQQLRLKKGEEAAEVAEAIFDWADAQGLRRWYGAGHVDGSCYFGEEDERGYLRLFAVWTYGHITLQFGELASGKHPSFEPADKRTELQRRLNEIPGISIPDERIDKYPSIALAALPDPDRRSQFLRVMEWAISQMKETSIESAST
jgi:hypothetical protein